MATKLHYLKRHLQIAIILNKNSFALFVVCTVVSRWFDSQDLTNFPLPSINPNHLNHSYYRKGTTNSNHNCTIHRCRLIEMVFGSERTFACLNITKWYVTCDLNLSKKIKSKRRKQNLIHLIEETDETNEIKPI